MEPSTAPWKHQEAKKWQYRNVNRNNVISDFSCLCSKLNNTEAKLTGVPPHCFVIVIVTVCVCFVVVLAYLLIVDTIHVVVMVVSYYLI